MNLSFLILISYDQLISFLLLPNFLLANQAFIKFFTN